MKKLLSLFLLLLMTVSVAVPTMAQETRTFLMRIDDTSGLTVKWGSASSVNPGTTTGSLVYDAGDVSVQQDLSSYSVTGKKPLISSANNPNYLVFGYSDKTAPAAIYVNGQEVSSSESYTSKEGRWPTQTTVTYYYRQIDISNLPDPAIIEVYRNSSNYPFQYPLSLSVTDPNANEPNGNADVTSFVNTTWGNKNVKGASSTTFRYGDSFTLASRSTQGTATLDGNAVSRSGQNYTFAPFPKVGGNAFVYTVPDYTHLYNVSVTSDDNSYVLGKSENFRQGETVTVYVKREPFTTSGASVSYSPTTYNGQQCYAGTFTAPANDVALSMTFHKKLTVGAMNSTYVQSLQVKDAFGNVKTVSGSSYSFDKGDKLVVNTVVAPFASTPAMTFAANGSNFKAEYALNDAVTVSVTDFERTVTTRTDDNSGYILGLTATNTAGQTRSLTFGTPFQATKNEVVKITTSVAPIMATVNGSPLTFAADGSNRSAQFTVTDNMAAEVNFYASVTVNADAADYVLAIQAKNGDTVAQNGQLGQSMTVAAGQQVYIYTKTNPFENNKGLTFTAGQYNGHACYVASFPVDATAATTNVQLTLTRPFVAKTDGPNMILGFKGVNTYGEECSLLPFVNGTVNATYTQGETYVLYSKYQPGSMKPMLSFADDTYEGTVCRKAEFNPASLALTDGANLQLNYCDNVLYVMVNDDYADPGFIANNIYSQVIDGFTQIHDDGSEQEVANKNMNGSNEDNYRFGFDNYGTCQSNFMAGDTYSLDLIRRPESICFTGQDELPLTRYYKANDVYHYVYTFIPQSWDPDNEIYTKLNLTFGDLNESQSGPEVSTFTVKLKVDRDNAVKVTRYINSNQIYDPDEDGGVIILPAGQYVDVAIPESGWAYVEVTDPDLYDFMSCVDEDENVDFLDYDAPTSYRVTIRSTRATSDTSQIETPNDKFTITTQSRASYAWYSLNVFVDDPSNVHLEIGPKNEKSSANKEITDLHAGTNTVAYNQYDTYAVVTSTGVQDIYNVTLDGTDVWNDNAGRFVADLSAATNNSTLNIISRRPIEAGSKTFTLRVDRPEFLDGVRRFVSASDFANVTDLQAGDNELTFDDGNTYTIYIGNYLWQPRSVTMTAGGTTTALEGSYQNTVYDFTPTEGCVVTVTYGELDELPSFWVLTDVPDNVQEIQNQTRDINTPITEQQTQINFRAGDVMAFNVSGRTHPKDIYFQDANGNSVNLTEKNSIYSFTPTDGGELHITYNQTVEKPKPTFTIYVDDASKLTFAQYDEYSKDLNLEDGLNTIEFKDYEGEYYCGEEDFVFKSNQAATSFTLDGVEVEPDFKKGIYTYTIAPDENSEVVIIFAQAPQFDLYLDDPTKVASISGIDTQLVNGQNHFEFTAGQTFVLTPTEGNVPQAVLVDDVEVEAVDGTYTLAPTDLGTVKVFFNYVPGVAPYYTSHIDFAGDADLNLLNYGWIDDTNISDMSVLDGRVLVSANTEIGINYLNNNYHVNSVTVNGASQTVTGSVYVKVRNADVTFGFDVTAPTVYHYTILANPSDVNVYYDEQNAIDLEPRYIANPDYDPEDPNSPEAILDPTFDNDFILTGSSLKPEIKISAKEMRFITSLTTKVGEADAVAVQPNEYGIYTIAPDEGLVINVVSGAVTNDDVLTVHFEGDLDHVAISGVSLSGTQSKRSFEVGTPNSTVNFSELYDGALMFSFSANSEIDGTLYPATTHVYLDDEEIFLSQELLGMAYLVAAHNNSVLRVNVQPQEINYSIKVDNPDAIVVYTGADVTDGVIALEDGDSQNVYNFSTNIFEYTEIKIAPVEPYIIGSVVLTNELTSLNGELSPEADGTYVLSLYNGNMYTVDVVELDKNLVVVFEGDFENKFFEASLSTDKRPAESFTINEKHNVISFNAAHDGEMQFSFVAGEGEGADFVEVESKVYLNGEVITAEEGVYTFTVTDHSILRVYLEMAAAAEPEKHDVTFTFTEENEGTFSIWREAVQLFDHHDGNTVMVNELHGTLIHVMSANEEPLAVFVTRGAAAAAPGKNKAPRSAATETLFGTDVTVPVENDMTIEVMPAIQTGVESVDANRGTSDIYNLQGILIKADATTDDLKQLPAGLYIHNGRKIVVK